MSTKKITTLLALGIIILSTCTVVLANQSDKDLSHSLNKIDKNSSANWDRLPDLNSLSFFIANPSFSYIQTNNESLYSWLDFRISSISGIEIEALEKMNAGNDWSIFIDFMGEEIETDTIQNEIDLQEVDKIDESQLSNDQNIIKEKEIINPALKGKNERKVDEIIFKDQIFVDQTEEGIITLKDGYIRFNLLSKTKAEYCFDTSSENTALERASSLEHKTQIPDIPVYTNRKVEAFIRLYTVRKRDVFIKAIERMPKYQAMISRVLEEYDLPQNLIYLAVVESNLNPNARSKANAVGLWQFMSYTGKHYNLTRSWWHDDRLDPKRSTVAAAKYLKVLHKMFEGNWELALAAYNSGSGTVRRAIRGAKRQGKSSDFWSLRLPRETRGYVPAFYAVTSIFEDLQKYNFSKIKVIENEQTEKTIDVGGGVSLKQLALILSMEHKNLMELNPRLRLRGLTPPTLKEFEIAIPNQMEISQAQKSKMEELKKNRHKQWKVYRVQEGDTLWSISRSFRIPMSQILANNWIKKKNFLRIGQKLMLPVPSDWTPPKLPSTTELAKIDLEKIPGITLVHIVKKGETLWQISLKYNVSIKNIKYWNRRALKRRYLKIGTELVLKIPVTLVSKSM